MPIRPENKALYPREWPAISREIRQRAENKCEECGVSNGELGGRKPDGTWCAALPTGTNGLGLSWPMQGDYGWCADAATGEGIRLRIVRIVLTVAHLDHQPENCDPDNLRAWCQRCHNRYDAATRRAGIKQRQFAASADSDLFAPSPTGEADG